MSSYTPNACGHRILSKLADGAAFAEELRPQGRDIRHAHFTIGALSRDRLIVVTRAGYEITTAGLERLAELNGSVSTVDPCRKGPTSTGASVGHVPLDGGRNLSPPRQNMPASSDIAPAQSDLVFGMRAQG